MQQISAYNSNSNSNELAAYSSSSSSGGGNSGSASTSELQQYAHVNPSFGLVGQQKDIALALQRGQGRSPAQRGNASPSNQQKQSKKR